MTLDRTRPFFLRLLALAFLVLVPPVALLTHGALNEFAHGMVPEMDKKATTVGRDLASSIERAIGYGIPLDKLYGMTGFFSPVLDANKELRYLAVTDRDGRILFVQGTDPAILAPYFAVADPESTASRKSLIEGFIDITQPLSARSGVVGALHVGLDQAYVENRLMEIAVDIGVVALVSLLVATEILLFVVTFNITGPIRSLSTVMDRVRRGDFSATCGLISEDEVGRFVHGFNAAIRHVDSLFRRLEAYVDEIRTGHFDKSVVERVGGIEDRIRALFRFSTSGQPEQITEHQVTDIRLPLFLFVFAEEISRSFMPFYIRDLYAPTPDLGVETAIALPIAAFMLFTAAVSPWGARMAARRGSRRVFLAGLPPAILGFIMSAAAQGVWDFILWRSLTGVGYALITMSCQSYIAQASQSQSRTQGLGVYVGAVLTASVCGTGIGGVLAERMGFRAAFAISAALAFIAGLLIYRLMDATPPRTVGAMPRTGQVLGLLRNWRFSALVVFAAIPAKMALTGFFFFLVPMTLIQAPDTDLSDVARVMMMYPIAVVVLSPLSARLADRLGWKAGLVAVGGLVGSVGLLLPSLIGNSELLGLSIVLLGVSHGLSASPQLAMIPDVCRTECHDLGQTNVLAFLRLAERVGSVIGPLLAAAFIPALGYGGAVAALGWVVLAMSVVFALLSFAYRSVPHIEAEATE